MKVQLTITLSETGKVFLTGPLKDKLLCLGLLEFAKIALFSQDTTSIPNIIPVTSPPPPPKLES